MHLISTVFYFDTIALATKFAQSIDDVCFQEILSVSWTECNDLKKNQSWCVEVLSNEKLRASIYQPYTEFIKKFEIKKLPNKDWLALSYDNFNPIIIDNFRVFGSHRKNDALVKNKINIEINAAMAFGSGEHYTTAGCLRAIWHLLNPLKHKTCLDLGCGSGILAIAMAKIGVKRVYAFDNDPIAVDVSKTNIHLNKIEKNIQVLCNKTNEFCRNNYDFIVANILENPLLELSHDIISCLNYNGFLILSGFVEYQKIEKTYSSLGLKFKYRIKMQDWYVCIFTKQ